MAEPKIYVPRSSAKETVFEGGGSIIKVGFHAETLIAFVKANTNERGFINLNISKRREPSPHGDTHSVALDTWKPKPGAQPTQRQASRPSAPPPPADVDDSQVPF